MDLDMVDSCAPPYLRQAGGGKHEERAQDLHSRQSARGQVVTHHLAPAITDFILDENQKCCDNKLEQALTLLHSPGSKEIKTSRQTSTHHPHIFGNPMNKRGSEFMRRNMPWEVPSMPTVAYDPHLLPKQATPLGIRKAGFVDQAIPAGGFVRI